MKILTIRGKNLASLESFEVELESGPLAHVGIFAITGPTGAGKTTLLDALCVALFDRTPRLSNQAGVPVGTADQDEGARVRANDVRGLLRRGAGEGFAEVDFIGRDRRSYRARWSVHRGRRRASGKLQNSEVSLTDIETGQVVAGKKRETLEAIEDRLGLSFEQFRRSALLAQNDFAAFLRADKEQRSDLLERMTGTEIYTRLSIAAFRRASDEVKALSALEATADASAILDDEARALLVTRRDALRAKHKEEQQSVRAVEATLRWFDEMRKAELAIVEAKEAHAQAQHKVVELQETERRVALVRQARNHRSAVDKAADSKEQSLKAVAQGQQAEQEHASATIALEASAAAVQSAARAVEAARDRYLAALDAERAQLTERAQSLQSWLQGHASLAASGGEDAELAVLYPEALDELRPELEERVAEHRLHITTTRAHELETQKLHALAKEACEGLAQQTEGSHLSALREQDTLLTRQQSGVQALQGIVATQLRAREQQTRAQAEAQQATADIARLTLDVTARAQAEKTSTAALAEAQAAFDRIRLALDLSEHRAHLKEGESCPLCGSLEHPWREHDATAQVVGEQEQRVEQLRAELEGHRQARAQLASSLATLEHVHRKAVEESTSRGHEADQAAVQVTEHLKQPALLPLALSAEPEALAATQVELGTGHKALAEQLTAAEALEARYRQAIAAQAQASTAWTTATETRQEAELRHEKAHARLTSCQGYRYQSRDAALAACKSAQAVCETKREGAPQWVPAKEHGVLLAAQLAEQAAGKALVAAQEKRKSCKARVVETEAAMAQGEARLQEVLTTLQCTRAELLERLATTDEWLSEAEASAQVASRQVAEATVRLHERELRCEELRGLQPPAVSEEQAKGKLAELTLQLEALVEEGLTVGAELRADEEARKRRAELGETIAAAIERVRIFRTLSDLIGSADGKKFRVFAQSLTLESLLVGANEHLKELAPRYLLERVPGHDLDLQVIDRDLADEVRSVNSLSGGESFLISLALALGLSSLASKDVRVESLLVDEGFGSLDGDTLEVALSVLDSLQATGRKVGLISHVPGFAERIGAQVIVTPQGGGRSTVRVLGPMSYG